MEKDSLSFEELSNVVAGTKDRKIAIEKNLEHPELFRQKKIEELKQDLSFLNQVQQEQQIVNERKPR